VQHRLADTLKTLLDRSVGRPLDIATAYFSVSGYRLIKNGLHHLGAFRLLLGSEPHAGEDIGLRADPQRLKGDLEAEPFAAETLKLVEDLIALLHADKVQVRLFEKGFLHAKAYLFHQDKIDPHNPADRLQPYAAIVGSSNFTPKPCTNTSRRSSGPTRPSLAAAPWTWPSSRRIPSRKPAASSPATMAC
jgi:hypothetical protein